MIQRHPDIVRDQKSNDTDSVASCNDRGVLWYTRSECWVIKSVDENSPYFAIAAGSITNVFHTAHTRMLQDPSNPNVMLGKTRKSKILIKNTLKSS